MAEELQTTPFAEKLKAFDEELAGIRTQAAQLAEERGRADIADEIRRSGRTLTVGNAVSVPEMPNIEQVGSTAQNGSRAISNILANTNNLLTQAPKDSIERLLEKKPNLIVPGLLTDKTGKMDFQTVLNQLTQEPAFSREQKIRDVYKEFGIDESFNLLKTIQGQGVSVRKELDKLDKQEENELLRVENIGGGTLNQLRAEQQRIQEDYRAKRAPFAAQLAGYALESEMLQGNIQLARNYANDLIDAATYDFEKKVDYMKSVRTMFSDVLDSMEEELKLAYKEAEAEVNKEYERQKKEREKIVSWATSFDTSGALLGKNLATISFDEAADLVRDYLALNAVRGGADLLSVDEARKLRVPYGTTKGEAAALGIIPQKEAVGTSDSAFWTAINRGVNDLQQGIVWGEVFNRIKQQFPNVPNSQIDNALGTSFREPGAFEAFKAKTRSSNTFLVGNPNFQWDLSE